MFPSVQLHCLVAILCLAVHGEDQVTNTPVNCTVEKCAGFKVEFEAGSEVAWDCKEQSACENTTFIVNSDSTLVGRLDCENYDRACYNAKIIVENSDLENADYHLDCCDTDEAHDTSDACNWLTLSLFDSFLDATCDKSNFEHVQAHLYGASKLELRPVSSLPNDNQLQVFLYDANARFQDGGIGPYVLNTNHHVDCDWNDLQACNGSTINFVPGSNSTWRCRKLEACANTTFVIGSNSTLDRDMDCDKADRACVGAKIEIHSSDLLSTAFALDCSSKGNVETCADVWLTLVDSSVRLHCDNVTCLNFKAFLYGNSRLQLGSETTLPGTDQFQVTLFGPTAVFADNGIGPYVLIHKSLTTTTLPIASSTAKHSTTGTPTMPLTTMLPTTSMLSTTVRPTTVRPKTSVETTSKEPVTEKPSTEEPITTEPTEKPTTEEPTTEKPTTEKPTSEETTTEKPATDNPTTTEEPTTQSTDGTDNSGGGKSMFEILVVVLGGIGVVTIFVLAVIGVYLAFKKCFEKSPKVGDEVVHELEFVRDSVQQAEGGSHPEFVAPPIVTTKAKPKTAVIEMQRVRSASELYIDAQPDGVRQSQAEMPATKGEAARGEGETTRGGDKGFVGDAVADEDVEDEMLYFAGSDWPTAGDKTPGGPPHRKEMKS